MYPSPPTPITPSTLLALPRELRDKICTYLALSSDFTILPTCRQLNEEGTPLLYKYGIYRIRALTFRKERLAFAPPLIQASLIQNLFISMPRVLSDKRKSPDYEISLPTEHLLEKFGGTEVRRRWCYFDL